MAALSLRLPDVEKHNAAHHDLERIVRQWPLQRLGLVPRRAHPNVPFLIGGKDHGHCLRMDRLDHGIRCGREKSVDLMRHRLRLRAAFAIERRPDASEGEQWSVIAQREPDHVLRLRPRVRLRRVFGEAVGRTRQRFSGLSQLRQCGDDVSRMLVTGGPPVRGGGGMPQRISTISLPASVLRITGAE